MRRPPASARTHPLNADSPQHKLRIETVEIRTDAVVLIDQLALPADERYVTCLTWRDVAARIRDMTVRGAPAIGVAAAGALALAARAAAFAGQGDRAAFNAALDEAAAGLAQTRPTAVNLTWAIAEMRTLWQRCDAAPEECWLTLLARAREIHDDDIRRCYAIGAFGAPLFAPGAAILTHCNAGALATAGYGTALGVIRACHERYGGAVSVFVDETRPWLQGARLTAWELSVEGIEYCVITDGMAGHFISRGEVDGIVVGADRIAANGDTANKIGTYGVALLAKAHGIPFYVAAPSSTFDLSLATGAEIPIEQRDPREVTHGFGRTTAPEGVKVYNPAFDVTPAALIAGIVTEKGLIRPVNETNIRATLNQNSQAAG